MSDYKKEIITQIVLQILPLCSRSRDRVKTIKELNQILSQALTRVEEAAREEDRVKLINALERINSQCECIKGLTAISNEIDLLSPSEEKE